MKWLLKATILCAGIGLAAGAHADANSATVEYGKEMREAQKRYAEAQQEYTLQRRALQRKFAQQFDEVQQNYQSERRELTNKHRKQQMLFRKQSVDSSRQHQSNKQKAQAEFQKELKVANRALEDANRSHQAELRRAELEYRKQLQQAQQELNKKQREHRGGGADYQKAHEDYENAVAKYADAYQQRRQESEEVYYQAQVDYQAKQAMIEEKRAAQLGANDQERWKLNSEREERQEIAQQEYAQQLQELEDEYRQQQARLERELEEKQAESESRLAAHRSTYNEAVRKLEEQQDLISQGQARTAELGVYLAPTNEGAIIIDRVLRRSAAEQAGLKRDDVLVAINKTKLPSKDKSGAALRVALDTIGKAEVGEVVRLDLKRAGKPLTKSVAIKLPEFTPYTNIHDLQSRLHNRRLPDNSTVSFNDWLSANSTSSYLMQSRLEMTVLNKQLGGYFGVDDGVLIANAAKDNVFDLEPGDVIVSISGRSVSTPNKVTQLLGTYEPGEQLEMEIVRNKKRKTLNVQLPDR